MQDKTGKKSGSILEQASYFFSIIAAIASVAFPIYNKYFENTAPPEGAGDLSLTEDASGDSNRPDSLWDSPHAPEDFNSNEECLSYTADMMSQGNYEIALSFLTNFIDIDGLDDETIVTARYNRGICYFCMGDYYQAVIDLDYAATRSNDPTAYYNLGCAYLEIGNYQAARAAYGKAQSIEEDSVAPTEKRQLYRDAKRYAGQLTQTTNTE